MRTITFLWFWHLCWNNDKKWTLLTTIMIPLLPMGMVLTFHRLLNSKQLSHLSVLLCMALTAWINEIILKPALAIPPLDDSCFAGCTAPSTFVALSFSTFIIYLYRLIFSDPKELVSAIGWGVVAILEFIAHPFSNYLTWANDAISIIPGVVIGILWCVILENKYFDQTLFRICKLFKLDNDITNEGYEKDFVPK